MTEITYVQSQLACKLAVSGHLLRLINKESRRNNPDRLLIERLRSERNSHLDWAARLKLRLKVLSQR